MIDDCYINNLAKNQVSTVFHSSVIRSSVSSTKDLCMETPFFVSCHVQRATNMAAVK